ncbi:metallophosphoesterase [Flavobacterium terrisoli]|uniref:metallophosphoesterase n=1 Tax=Flavobacterium terrisoli TaxID=3242195 RepID=UPI00254304EA|nr:metallophosphoesterase [Flavobacterium buctense]
MKLFCINSATSKYCKLFVVVSVFVLLQSCATHQPQYNKNNNKSVTTEATDSTNAVHTFYLIGDAGNAEMDSTIITLKSLKKKLDKSNKNATLLFLGDNIYPAGLPKKEDSERKLAEHRLDVQLNIAENFKGKTVFIPGNHDWYNNGLDGLKRQQEYVEKKLGKKSFLPKDGCSIESININEEIILIIVDSQWYITNWDNHPTINEDCEIKTRTQFLEEFRSEIKKARGKTTIVAIHHPMFSNGAHGGKYDFKSHLQPIPILGTLKNLLRKTTGISNADLQNIHYNELKRNLVAAAQHNEKVIFVSGHEHNLQYIVEENIPQIISGSGSKKTAVKNTGNGQYSHGENGFAVLKIYADGSSKVKFINAQTENTEFETKIFGADHNKIKYEYQKVFPDSIKTSIYTEKETTKSKFYSFLWGKRFRQYYSTPITAKVVDLDTLQGGLTPLRKGGGTQSRALRLTTKDGRQFVMRAMKKNASQYIQASMFKDQYVQKQFENTASENLVKDVFTGSYPYAPFVVGTLSDAIGVNRLNSKLYYIPKQKALGEFNSEFGDELYLFEEQASDGNLLLSEPNFTGNIISTNEVLLETQSDESKIVDEKTYLRARLFDMLIGDWDRHQDQWRWLEFKENAKTIYKPLPRDRDQPFSRMSDGFLLGAAVRLIPAAKLLRKYEDDLKDVKGFNTEPFPLDIAFIKQSGKEDWDEQVKFIQNNITEEVIEKAFDNVPNEVKDQTVVEIKNMLKNRKDNLQKIADRYFNLVNKTAVITGTVKDDFFKISCLENGSVTINGFRKKKDGLPEAFHSKTYDPKVTCEIWIYGLDDKDSFEVTGKSKKIKIRLIGGQNNDDFKIEKGQNIVIYDYKSKQNDITNAKKATLKLQDSYEVNVYDYKKIKNNINQIIPIIGANPDDGFKIGINNLYTRYGFELNPFSSQHQVKAAYYFATNGYELTYRLEVAKIFKHLNLEVTTGLQSPNFSQNFFGYGNETDNPDDDLGMDYNRIRVRSYNFIPSLKWRSKSGSSVNFGITYESIEVQNTQGRFVENNPQLPTYLFDEVEFIGTSMTFDFENYDSKTYPTLGMKTAISIGYKSSLEEDNSYGYIIPEISITHKLNPSGKLVLATKLKSHINIGNDFEFYQAASIGGIDGLRGFRNQRFTGNRSFYQNTDLRYSFSSMKTRIIPIKIGLYGGFDYGRIWLKGEDSDKWNNSYGGGFFINGVETVNANLGLFNSTDGIRIAFGLGFGF